MNCTDKVVNVPEYVAANLRESYRPRNVCRRHVTVYASVCEGCIVGQHSLAYESITR
jgi:hypothetical protein